MYFIRRTTFVYSYVHVHGNNSVVPGLRHNYEQQVYHFLRSLHELKHVWQKIASQN